MTNNGDFVLFWQRPIRTYCVKALKLIIQHVLNTKRNYVHVLRPSCVSCGTFFFVSFQTIVIFETRVLHERRIFSPGHIVYGKCRNHPPPPHPTGNPGTSAHICMTILCARVNFNRLVDALASGRTRRRIPRTTTISFV